MKKGVIGFQARSHTKEVLFFLLDGFEIKLLEGFTLDAWDEPLYHPRYVYCNQPPFISHACPMRQHSLIHFKIMWNRQQYDIFMMEIILKIWALILNFQ